MRMVLLEPTIFTLLTVNIYGGWYNLSGSAVT
jgi:hypothetical protein